MTASQERHLLEIKQRFDYLVDYKYRIGAAEHGGDLQNMPEEQLLLEALNEVVDLFTYLITLQQRIKRRRPAPQS